MGQVQGDNKQYWQNFWVCSSPFLSSSLFLQADEQQIEEQPVVNPAAINFYDCDGELFNQLKVDFGDNSLGFLDLEPFLAECKFESGMKYCRVRVGSEQPVTALLRLQTRDWSVVAEASKPFSATEKYLVTVDQDPERSTWITVLNDTDTELEVRARLFLGKRSPEADLRIPAFGARVFDCRILFSEVFAANSEMAQAYMRVSAIGAGTGYIQTLNVPVNSKNIRVFSVIS